MKKLIAFVAATFAAVSLASAADITIGARGAFGLGLGTSVEDPLELDTGKCLDFGFTAFGKIGLTEAIAIQPELGFTHHTVGMKYDLDLGMFGSYSAKGTMGVNTLDFAVLGVYDIAINDAFTVSPFAGPQLGFVLGKGNGGGDMDGDVEFKSPILFDIVLGAGVSYKVGPGAIVGDLRYNLGLIALKEKDSEKTLCTPRALKLSVGYQIKL